VRSARAVGVEHYPWGWSWRRVWRIRWVVANAVSAASR
jgi:hypothetical protein